jgi:hypothetical protein
VSDNNYALLDPKKSTDGLMITPKKDSKFQIEINCDKEKKQPIYEVKDSGITISSRDGCGIINEAARVFFKNKIVFSLVFMAVGMVFMIFGGWKWDSLLLFVGFFAGFSAVFFLFWAFVDYEQSTKSYVIISVVAIIIGAILGYVCKLFDFVSYFTLGFFGGFFLAKFLFATFPNSAMADWVVTMITYIVAVVVGGICIFVGKYFMVIITAIIGSLLFWYNFGFLIGVLPNMFDFIEQFKTYGKFNALNITFLALAGVSALGFVVFQYKMIAREKRRKKLDEDKKYENLI